MKYYKLSVLILLTSVCAVQAQTWDGSSIESDDGQFSTTIGGRIHLDATGFSDDRRSISNDTEVRRARLFAKGILYGDFEYKAQFEFSEDEVESRDLFVKHRPTGITVGQFKTPLSLEEQASSNTMTFVERGLPTALVTSRRLGIGWDKNFDNATLAFAAYDHATDGADESPGIGGRFTWNHEYAEDSLVHLGIGVLLEGPDNDTDDTLRIRSRSEVEVGPSLIDTGTIENVDDVTKLGLEAAWQNGPWSVQSEYIRSKVETNTIDPEFSSYYVYLSYFLTGETRSYRNGKFRRIKMEGTQGAWQIALRFSHLDLDEVNGGELDSMALGANYYFNPHTRILTSLNFADSTQNELDDDPTSLQVRFQLDF